MLNYKEVLREIYKYQILQNDMIDFSKQYKKTYEEAQIHFKEKNRREELLKSYQNLEESYKKIKNNNIFSKMEEEIKL